MLQLLGEYECKIDVKGRMRLPTPLLKQLGKVGPHTFVVNRGIERCLTLYPQEVWFEESKKVNALNTFLKKNREFIRFFYRGAQEVVTDNNDRVLLTKRLLDYAGIDKDAILSAFNNRVEIWANDKYDKLIEDEEPDDFNDLAEEVMGGKNGEN